MVHGQVEVSPGTQRKPDANRKMNSPLARWALAKDANNKTVRHDAATLFVARIEKARLIIASIHLMGEVAGPRTQMSGLGIFCDVISLRPHVAVKRVVRVDVRSCNLTGWINANGKSSLAGTCSCARRVEGGNRAVFVAHEAVNHTVRIDGDPGDRPDHVDALRYGPLGRVRRVEGGNRAISGAHGAVTHAVRIKIWHRDCACRIDAQRVELRVGTARRIEAGDGAVGSAHEAVRYVIRVDVGPGDCTRRINGSRKGNKGTLVRPGRVEGGKFVVRTEHEAVSYATRIDEACVLSTYTIKVHRRA